MIVYIASEAGNLIRPAVKNILHGFLLRHNPYSCPYLLNYTICIVLL